MLTTQTANNAGLCPLWDDIVTLEDRHAAEVEAARDNAFSSLNAKGTERQHIVQTVIGDSGTSDAQVGSANLLILP